MFAFALTCTFAGMVSIVLGICLVSIPAWIKVVLIAVISMSAIAIMSIAGIAAARR